MFFSRRKAAVQRVVPVRPAAIEGLEGRCLLSGSGASMAPAMHGGNSGPSINMPQNGTPGGKNAGVGQEIKGVVTAVDVAGNKITVATEHGGPITTFSIPASAIVTVKDTVGGLAAIKAGAEVDIRLSAIDGSVVSVSAENQKAKDNDKNENQGPKIEGVVNSVNVLAGTLTITAEHAATPTVFTISSTAKISLNGKPATLADIAAGAKAEIHFALDGTTILSVEIVSAGV